MKQALAKVTSEILPQNSHEWIEVCKNPQVTYKALRNVKTIDDALDSGTPSLALIKREKGEDYAEAFIKAWLVDLQMSINVKNKLNESMINQLAEVILDEFWYLNLAGIKTFFYGAKTGRYLVSKDNPMGEYFETLSIPKVLGMLRKFSDEWFQIAEWRSESDHHYNKQSSNNFRIAPRTKDLLNDNERAIINGDNKDA